MSGNININGSGHVNGGTYDNVTINGSGSINGDLTCGSMTINGSGKIRGDLHTDGSLTINGSGSVVGSITGNGHISMNGSGKVGGSVHCQSFHSAGSGAVDGDCEGEEIVMEGGSQIGGLLNGENIRLVLYPHCHMTIGNIGGTDITVEHKPNQTLDKTVKLFGIRIPLGGSHTEEHGNSILETDTIEGDTITLTNTKANRVSGRIVKIGSGCQIGRVEYTETYEAEETSQVETVVQV